MQGMVPLTIAFPHPAPGYAEVPTLDHCGGKAINLIRLAAAGLPVPAGLVITTDAYRSYVAHNDLTALITPDLMGLTAGDADQLEAASARIRAAFSAGDLPADLRAALASAVETYGGTPVAVRSSATAEDLPELSFAGQQDTFLNVIGTDAVLAAVVDCWSSLWTARAIGYRIRAGIPHDDAAVAVVVQRMVAAEVSGVLFTADPLTGQRDKVVVDATYGLGEALVSGLVEPDHYVVGDGGQVLERTPGAKAVATVARADGGVDTVPRASGGLALSDPQLVELAALGRRVEGLYGSPQDIEWAYGEGRLWLLQSRAVTSLYPLPDPSSAPGDPSWDGFPAWLSFGAHQGMLQPITPLGQDGLILLARGLTRLFGGQTGHQVTTSVPFLRVAGDRLWVRLDHALRRPVGRRVVPIFLGIADPATAQLLTKLDDPRLAVGTAPGQAPPVRVLRKAAPFFRKVASALPTMVHNPGQVRLNLEAACNRLVTDAEARERAAAQSPAGEARLEARLDAMQDSLEAAFSVLLTRFGPIMVPGALTQKRLVSLGGPDALTTLRSLDGNVTTTMDLELWRVAEVIRADSAARARFTSSDAHELAVAYTTGDLPTPVTAAIAAFLATWGMRAVGEIDLGKPRWADDPTAVMSSLQAYAALPDDAETPAAGFERGKTEAVAALDRLTATLTRQGLMGRLRAKQIAALVKRVRATFGARETPKFTIVRILGVVRSGLLASGAELVAAGRLTEPDDVLMLHVGELRAAWESDPVTLRTLVAERRAGYAREVRRRQVPRLMLGDGRTFYEGVADPGDGSLGGSPVSPGVAEGPVRVVLSPANAGLKPGEILVCPGTDPAWTPLFLVAAGLVTEVGGMMTHGSVVAREYGIPAVVGVHDATTRLTTGMRIRLDGSAGTITILD